MFTTFREELAARKADAIILFVIDCILQMERHGPTIWVKPY